MPLVLLVDEVETGTDRIDKVAVNVISMMMTRMAGLCVLCPIIIMVLAAPALVIHITPPHGRNTD